jgi:hypothetical protein
VNWWKKWLFPFWKQPLNIDYDPKSETTRNFYAHVQDKFHFAITGHTAAEIVYLNADADKPLMGMMTYKN